MPCSTTTADATSSTIAQTPRDEPTAPFVSHIDAPQRFPADAHTFLKKINNAIVNDDDVGAWEADLFDCCTSCSIAFYACCLPCIATGDSMRHIGRSRSIVALSMLVLVVGAAVLYVLCQTQGRYEKYNYGRYRANTNEAYEPNGNYLIGALACVLAYEAIVGRVRNIVRRHYRIPGDCLDDFCAAFWCTCCVVAQVSSHTERAAKKLSDKQAVSTLPAYSDTPMSQCSSKSVVSLNHPKTC